MHPWLQYSLLTVLLWGSMGFLGKLASRSVPTQAMPLMGALGGLLVFPVVLALLHRQLRFDWQDANVWFGLLAGMIGATGTVLFYAAISRGEASRVVVITATYPVLTFLLSLLFLGETMSLQKLIGVALAVAGVCLLAFK